MPCLGRVTTRAHRTSLASNPEPGPRTGRPRRGARTPRTRPAGRTGPMPGPRPTGHQTPPCGCRPRMSAGCACWRRCRPVTRVRPTRPTAAAGAPGRTCAAWSCPCPATQPAATAWAIMTRTATTWTRGSSSRCPNPRATCPTTPAPARRPVSRCASPPAGTGRLATRCLGHLDRRSGRWRAARRAGRPDRGAPSSGGRGRRPPRHAPGYGGPPGLPRPQRRPPAGPVRGSAHPPGRHQCPLLRRPAAPRADPPGLGRGLRDHRHARCGRGAPARRHHPPDPAPG
jgi:hypothetical protein